MLGTALAFVIVILTLCSFFLRKKYSFWSSQGVPVPPYWPLLGHLYQLFFSGRKWEYVDKIYKKYENEKFWGMYEGLSPSLHVKDPELIRDICVKDADHFTDRRSLKFFGKDKVFNEMVTVVKGEKWKSLRSLLTPTFTSGKIKGMFPLILSVGDNLVTKCNEELSKGKSVNMVSLLGEYTMDATSTCSFGVEANCLLGEKSTISEAAKDIANASASLIGIFKFTLLFVCPRLFGALGLQFTSDSMRRLEEVLNHTIKVRMESGNRRGDFLDILLDALEEQKKSEDSHKYPMTHDTIISQSLLFLLAGFDTTSNALSFTTYLLAKNPECQTKLRKELQKIYEADGGFTYQNIMEAQYLDTCFSESLRMYSIAHFIERICTREYRVPGTEIDIGVDTVVAIPVWSLHYDEKYWNEPTKYDPDRFLPENKQNIVPYTYMPFGVGPRNCIGMRFALINAKVALAKLCMNFELSLEPGFEEIILSPSPNTLRPDKNYLPLRLTKLK